MRKLTRDEVMESFKTKHGDRYDYSAFEYIDSQTESKIICKIHGVFLQTPNKHKQGRGCPACSSFQIVGVEEFIERAKLKHGDRYGYDLVRTEYSNTKNKVPVICHDHGIFKTSPANHMKGKGCRKCRDVNSAKDQKFSQEEFIRLATEKHGTKYDYSLVNYINCDTKVDIICSEHGIFSQSPYKHYKEGNGCPLCATIQKTQNKIRYRKELFLKESAEIHNNKYDYSLVNYVDCDTKVEIRCPTHGTFEQTPYSHLNLGFGCRLCSGSYPEQAISEFLIGKEVKFLPQKTFPECRDKNVLPFDFYLPDYNLCIEFDGRQHFMALEIFGGEEGLKDRQKKDAIKTRYCQENNIELLRINFKQLLNLREILMEILKLNYENAAEINPPASKDPCLAPESVDNSTSSS